MLPFILMFQSALKQSKPLVDCCWTLDGWLSLILITLCNANTGQRQEWRLSTSALYGILSVCVCVCGVLILGFGRLGFLSSPDYKVCHFKLTSVNSGLQIQNKCLGGVGAGCNTYTTIQGMRDEEETSQSIDTQIWNRSNTKYVLLSKGKMRHRTCPQSRDFNPDPQLSRSIQYSKAT
jgi:hypothetical protein